MKNDYVNNRGLTSSEAKELQQKFGKNELVPQKKENIFSKILHVVCEPMFLLLLVAAVIYFILGEPRDGLIMLIFVVGVMGIEVVQEWRTDKTLKALKDLSAPHVTVLRDNAETVILSADLVPGDVMMIYEGVKIPADGVIMSCNDLCVDESSLTGEAEGVWKTCDGEALETDSYWRMDYCYAGTLVTQGSASILVEKIGASTEYGKIGVSISQTVEEDTPLQKQTGSLVKTCVIIAAVLFLLVSGLTWFNLSGYGFGDRIIKSILSGITLSMAMIPEEFPVILTVFLSIGAWRLAKKNSLVRRLPSVETLGAVSVLCVDKTGTITMNQMTVQETWATGSEEELVHTMGLACETDAYDPMEKAMLRYCEENGVTKHHLFGGDLIDEYAFTSELKMMGHIWHHDDEVIIAAKGSPESIIPLCGMSGEELERVKSRVKVMSENGLRVIAVALARPDGKSDIPAEIIDCKLTLCGLIGLADPPRESVGKSIETCTKAGIRTVMITGDNGTTAMAIARKVGIPHAENVITGDMLDSMTDDELREKVKTVSIFSRVIPEHKMRIVKALRDNGEIVAMTGDGVNDAPALKYADIGIAMGSRGSEVAREAADLVLMDDNFSTIVETVKDGRRIFDNIRKAVGYVFAIHIPIAMSSLLAPILGVAPENLFLLPLHVVLLELVIDPTCSVVLERQPAEIDIMSRPPRNTNEKLLDFHLLIKSVLQGVSMFLTSFGIYYGMMTSGTVHVYVARAMGLVVIILANLFLVMVNSSDHDSVFITIARLAKDKVMWLVTAITFVGIGVILYSPLNAVLKLAPLTMYQIICSLVLAMASVLWYEIVKYFKRKKMRWTK